MKKTIHLLLFLLIIGISCSFGQDPNSKNANSDSMVKEKLYLTNTKLTSVEQNEIKDIKKSKFISYIFPKDITEDKQVIYYKVDNPYAELMPRLILYLKNDSGAFKLHSVQNRIAILIDKDFDIALFEQNAKTVGVNLSEITKEEFFN